MITRRAAVALFAALMMSACGSSIADELEAATESVTTESTNQDSVSPDSAAPTGESGETESYTTPSEDCAGGGRGHFDGSSPR